MHCCSDAPRAFWEAGVAQSALSLVSRSGPTVPVEPAAARVWQPLHPAVPVNTVLPAAAPVLEDEEPDDPELDDELEPEDDPPDGVPYPGRALLTFGGVEPTGGGPLAGWERSQLWKAVALTTRTLVRISE